MQKLSQRGEQENEKSLMQIFHKITPLSFIIRILGETVNWCQGRKKYVNVLAILAGFEYNNR